MKIKVSALRRIIKEEISRCLIEQASDEKKATIEKAEHLKAASDAASKQAAADDQEALELSDRAKKAQDDANKMSESEKELDEFWPTVARAAGAYAAGKISDKLIDEDEDEGLRETIKKIDGKWCLLSRKSKRNMGCYDDISGAENRERQISYFKKGK